LEMSIGQRRRGNIKAGVGGVGPAMKMRISITFDRGGSKRIKGRGLVTQFLSKQVGDDEDVGIVLS